MHNYVPDRWKIFTLYENGEPKLHRLIAGWVGGWASANHWKINSGISEIIETPSYYLITGFSGSTYRCYKESEGFTMLSQGIYNRLASGADSKYQIKLVEGVPAVIYGRD